MRATTATPVAARSASRPRTPSSSHGSDRRGGPTRGQLLPRPDLGDPDPRPRLRQERTSTTSSPKTFAPSRSRRPRSPGSRSSARTGSPAGATDGAARRPAGPGAGRRPRRIWSARGRALGCTPERPSRLAPAPGLARIRPSRPRARSMVTANTTRWIGRRRGQRAATFDVSRLLHGRGEARPRRQGKAPVRSMALRPVKTTAVCSQCPWSGSAGSHGRQRPPLPPPTPPPQARSRTPRGRPPLIAPPPPAAKPATRRRR